MEEQIYKSKPVWTISPNPAELSEWNPPDIPMDQLHVEQEHPFYYSEKTLIYKVPWYLGFLYVWSGAKCWLKTRKWPKKFYYFSKKHQRDREIFLDVYRHPQDFLGY